MKFEKTAFSGLIIISPDLRKDDRGYFFRTFCKEEFEKAGMPNMEFLQLNQSYNTQKGTFRGLHYQNPPFAEDKLVRCVSGSIFDMVVDIRKGSPTFLKWQGFELNGENAKMLFIPKGFAHGFITLEEHTTLAYHHTAYYEPGHEGGLSIFDERLNIELPEEIKVISERDKLHPMITEKFTGI